MTLRERCLAAQLLVLDVDGVLTAGGISYASHGHDVDSEVKTFHVRDGSALKLWHAAGRRSLIVTGRRSKIVEVRAAELGITRVIQGAADKRPALEAALIDWHVHSSSICYVGDDVPDVPAMQLAALAAAPADACPEARHAAHYVCRAKGGQGAVREVIALILAVR